MNDFWTNIFRYPRFFITSVLGSIITILYPIIKGLKYNKLKKFVLFFCFFLVFFILLIVKNMINI